MTKVVAALYEDLSQARDAVEELEAAGFLHDDISVVQGHKGSDAPDGDGQPDRTDMGDVARDAAKGAGVGAVLGGAGGLIAGLGLLTIPGLGPVLAIGPLLGLLTGVETGIPAGALTGSLIGALQLLDIPEDEAYQYSEGVRLGRALVTVHANGTDAPRAREILQHHDPVRMRRGNGTSARSGGETPPI